MNSYTALAGCYDALTTDVAYARRADWLEKLLRRSRLPVHTILDLACGTGTMTCLLAERGYEMIGTDASSEMLAEACAKSYGVEGIRPMFLCQSMPKLDLYGTVDAAICCLDSLNYLTDPEEVRKTFQRLRLFIAPQGMLVFDVRPVEQLMALDGQVFLDEREDVYCVWRASCHKQSHLVRYGLDLFSKQKNGTWRRSREEHSQRGYTAEELTQWLQEAGFREIRCYGDQKLRRPKDGEQRIYFTCVRGENYGR